jgi:glycerol-3-phosphate dehydrogenase
MPDSPRIVIDLLRAAVDMGADIINYLEATNICVAKNKVTGVEGVDMTAGRGFRFEAPVVVNTAGPWARKLAAQFDADYPELFQPSLAWNVLLNRPALSTHALALAPKKPKARTYFILPYKGKMLAGTDHGPWLAEPYANPMPDIETIRNFLNDLNLTIPGLNLTADDIGYIFSGLLPAKENGTQKLAVREKILDHSAQGGPWGLVSVSGVKYTTARLVAEKTLAAIEARCFHSDASVVTKALESNQVLSTPSLRTQALSKENKNFWKEVQEIITEEAVMHLDDLVCRRTSLWEDKGNFSGLVEGLSKITGWDALRQQSEITRLEKWCQNRAYPGPESSMPSTKVSRQNVGGSSQEAV